MHEPSQDLGAGGDRAAEEIGRPRPEHAADGNRVAAAAPVLRPLDRLRPLALEVRARSGRCRTPAGARPTGPGTRSTESSCARPADRSESSPRRSARRGSGPSCRRSRPPPRPSCRGRAPRRRSWRASRPRRARPGACRRRARACSLPSSRVPRLRAGCSRPRPGCRSSACAAVAASKFELDHLPVAFVRVVPVVEDVEEPVLQRELPGPRGVGRRRARRPWASSRRRSRDPTARRSSRG